MTSAAAAESGYFVNPQALLGLLFGAVAIAAERAGAETPRELHGTWVAELGGRLVTLDLRSTGTYLLAGVEGGWSGGAGRLELDDQPLSYRLSGDALVLTDRAGQTVRWARAR